MCQKKESKEGGRERREGGREGGRIMYLTCICKLFTTLQYKKKERESKERGGGRGGGR